MEPTTPQAQIPNTQESGVESVEIIINHVQNILEVNEAGVIETLKGIFTRVPQEGELFGVIELFQTQNFGINYNIFSKKDDSDKAGLGTEFTMINEGETLFPELSEYMEESFKGTNNETELITQRTRKIYFTFFSQCFEKAGGPQATLPTYLAFEEEDEYRDFRTGQVLNENEIAASLGYQVSE